MREARSGSSTRLAKPTSAALAVALDRYYSRGGYPRLHSGEVEDDGWADYLVETVFNRVLGVDIPDLFRFSSRSSSVISISRSRGGRGRR